LDITMAFCGHTDIRTVNRDILLPPHGPAEPAGRKKLGISAAVAASQA
jgi:hypothetical protein